MSHDYGFTDSFTPLLPPHEKQKKKKKKKKKSKEKKTHNEQQCPDPTFEPPAFSIPDKNSELSIPRPKKAKTTPNSADASSLQHQQTRTHDTAAASDRKRWSGSLMSSDNVSLAQVQLTDIPGYSRNADDLHHFIKSCEQQAGRGMMIVSAYLNVRILCAFLDLAVSLFQVKPVEQTSMVAYGKLRNFLNVNGVAALVRTMAVPSCVLCILPYSKEVTDIWNIEGWTAQNLVAVYIERIPAKPPLLQYPGDHIYKGLLMEDPDKLYAWQLMTLTLQFPRELLRRIAPTTHIEVYGESKWALALQSAYRAFAVEPPLKSKGRVFLFERLDDTRFKTDLSKYKRSLWPVTFWEFGLPSLSTSVFKAPVQLFPARKGGYITTDVPNIVKDPMILFRISDSMQKLNRNTIGEGWTFVVYDDILNRLEAAATDPYSAKQIHLALLILKQILQQDHCRVWRDWAVEPNDLPYDQSLATVKFMETLLRKFCSTAEYFILVDDINSMPEHLPAIERHKSKWLLDNACMFF